MSKLAEIDLDAISQDMLKEYQKLNPKTFQDINTLARKLKKEVVIHISSTPCGGGVAELLKRQMPMEKALGLEVIWLVIKAKPKFFEVTKKIHNCLQGEVGFLSEEEKETYLSVNRKLEKDLSAFLKRFKSGIVVVHDPQPLPLIGVIPRNFSSFLRLHIDLSSPNPLALEFLKPFIVNYDLVIISNKDYLPALPWLKKSKVKIVYPAIDPFLNKNKLLSRDMVEKVLAPFNINLSKPLVTQISRFDPWKDPLGVIRAYYLAKNKIPDLQLAMVGFFVAADDPEAITIFNQVKKYAETDPDVHFYFDLKQLKNTPQDIFVNAMRDASQIILQGSIREGFGLVITEAMWNGKPIIARINSGSLKQIKHKKNGILINSPEEMGKEIISLLKNKELREKLGKNAQHSVKQHFLIPRFIADNLKLYCQARERNEKL